MDSIGIVPELSVFKYGQSSLHPCSVFLLINTFHLQVLEKAYCYRVVSAVTFSAHAAFNQSISLQKSLELIAGILDPPFGMGDQIPNNGTVFNGHDQGRDYRIDNLQ